MTTSKMDIKKYSVSEQENLVQIVNVLQADDNNISIVKFCKKF